MKAVLGAALALVLSGVTPSFGQAAEAGEDPVMVVELFTSQGCSSCPPADAYLGELCERKGILGLTWPVDYWDYIGWKDTFATHDNVRRQKLYAKSLKIRYVYTPQMVIGGAFDTVGSDRAKVEERILKRQAMSLPRIPVDVVEGEDGVFVSVGEAATAQEATVWLVHFDRRREVSVGAGENKGRTLIYYNIVRDVRAIGAWTGRPLRIPLASSEIEARGRDAGAILVQAGGYGPILGAAEFVLEPAR